MTVVEVAPGASPIVLAMPHVGTEVPPDILPRLSEVGQAFADTDWHIDRLYAGLLPDATVVRASFHRYALDANRDPEGISLYPGQNTTGLCPLTDFDGRPLYRPGEEPDAGEIAARRERFHAPYHAALAAEVERVRTLHGAAVLFDCHSIRSVIPFLFPGTLPVLNIGTYEGRSCAPAVEEAAVAASGASPYSWVLNGRFKGGWTTRHYGRPADGVHAIQLEIGQIAYMDEVPPWAYVPARADALRPHLAGLLHALDRLARSGALSGGTA